MRNPNGYGTVYKLSGNRRNPYIARVTIGWTEEGKQLYHTIGCFKSKPEGLKALADYHDIPNFTDRNITFEVVYNKFSERKFKEISSSNINGYKASYSVCQPLYKMKFRDIKTIHMQKVIDSCGKGRGTLRKIKVLFNQMYKFAMANDITNKDYSKYVELPKKEEETSREPFSDVEISLLWENVNRNKYINVILMLIYSGVRISELLDLKKEHVNLDERYFDIVGSKTQAGIRRVPIAQKTLPFFKQWMNENSEYLVCTPHNNHFTYRNYRDSYWDPFIKELKLNHTPHETRHTTTSLLVRANVNQTIIKKIIGHKGAMSLTERVYTHLEVHQLIDAIDSI